jgi:uncharacterized protein YhfF
MHLTKLTQIQVMSPTVTQFWEAFKVATNRLAPALPTEVYHFCDSEPDANELGELVLHGVKQATTSLLASCVFDKVSPPVMGDLNVITKWRGEPLCVIEITDVEVRPFRTVDAAYAHREGEGDKSLAYWRDAHRNFFERECQFMQMQFDESLPVVCIGFRCIYPKPLR